MNNNDQRNQGVSEFDLPERAYSRDQGEGRLRTGYRATFRQRYVNDLRVQFGWRTSDTRSMSDATAIRVLDAFTSGGAQIDRGGAANTPRLELFARATNVLNAVNPQRFGGVLTSPFFGLNS